MLQLSKVFRNKCEHMRTNAYIPTKFRSGCALRERRRGSAQSTGKGVFNYYRDISARDFWKSALLQN